MPVRNVALFVGQAIESILNQTYTEFEFVIIDDRSNDGTYEILQHYANSDRRIRVFRGEKKGFVACLNQGLKLCLGSYIARMDGDDLAEPNRFELQMGFLLANRNIGVCGSWIRLFGAKNETWHYRQNDEQIKNLMIFKRSGFGHNSVILKKEVYERFPYEAAFEFCEDYRLWCNIVSKSNIKLYNLPKVLTYYRIHDKQTIATKQNLQKALRERILHNFLNDLNIDLNKDEFLLFNKVRDSSTQLSDIEKSRAVGVFKKIEAKTKLRFDDIYGIFAQQLSLRGIEWKTPRH
jgi:glycosyltransferase involved in cell wall biosynthesis